ncbi:MAG: phosphosulfolactate synthase [Bacteroidales bacterium]|nr:phosphosulfolactate synthase [Bacteroidales bacterium]MDD4673643.1 phosphosulfolactate synthase [Bacteroidales bacterium]
MLQSSLNLPEREAKPRNNGLTMVMDKGLSDRELENMVSVSGQYVDLVKFGFGTAMVSSNIEKKIATLKQNGIKPYLGGTLFEAFIARNKFDEFRKLLDTLKLELAEVSDGTLEMQHDKKCEYIAKLSQQVTVISEVGSKQADVFIPNDDWVKMMKSELEAGSWKVIAEAREGGNVGIYNPDHSANSELIEQIMCNISIDDVLWEAPIKNQQAMFVNLLGANVNLGNIAPNEVIALESLRVGLRGDTFFKFL